MAVQNGLQGVVLYIMSGEQMVCYIMDRLGLNLTIF